MELDSRILEGKTYLDCFDTEVAKGFIGKECYLSDGVASFANVDNLNKAVLIEVDDENIKPYTLENIRWRYSSNFILPCEWVKEPEKKYRPYTMKEFLREYSIGESIFKIRDKRDPEHIYQFLYIGHSNSLVYLGGWALSLQDLFNYYESGDGIGDEETWQPFGVLEDD